MAGFSVVEEIKVPFSKWRTKSVEVGCLITDKWPLTTLVMRARRLLERYG